MRLAVISDIHLGDPSSAMAADTPQGCEIGTGYTRFAEAVRGQFGNDPLDYLIVLGDVLDFSIVHYSTAYSIGKTLFERMVGDGLLRSRRIDPSGSPSKYGPIIYVPGNHDLDMWHTVEYQVNIIQRIDKGKEAEKLRMSVPTIIHECADGSGLGVYLHGVSDIATREYGGLFLDSLTAPPIDWYFGFPNLYFVVEGETVWMTHGQYFNFFWSFLGQWALKVFGEELELRRPGHLDLVETVGINCPTGQLSCSSIGQAGPLTTIVRALEHDIKAGNMARIERYADRVFVALLARIDSRVLKFPLIKQIVRCIVKRLIDGLLNKSTPARDERDYLEKPDIKANFDEFYKATVYEIEEIRSTYPFDIPYPSRLIFGHTHRPIPWSSPDTVTVPACAGAPEREIEVCNTGGWLYHDADVGPGAEVFFYETGKGFSSRRIRYEPGE